MEIKNNPTTKKSADNISSSAENKLSPDISGTQNFRSLQSDMVDAVKTQDRSLAQMIIADKKRKRESEYSDKKILIDNKHSKKFWKLFLGVGIILLIVIIVTFGIKSVWQEKEKEEKPPRVQTTTAIILINKQIVLNIKTITENTFETSINKALAENKTESGDIIHLHFTKEIEVVDTEINKIKKTDITLPIKEFFELWNNDASDSLVRSFEKENYMFGFFNTAGKTEPFLLFKSKNFDQTYAGMLEWENVLCKNMQNIFQTENDCPQYKFKNAQLLGTDIRVLESESGKPAILYGFLNNDNMLIITQSMAVFKEISSLFD